MDSPTTDLDAAGQPLDHQLTDELTIRLTDRLANQIEEGLARLDEADATEHPAAFEAMDEAIRAELRDLERLTGDPDG